MGIMVSKDLSNNSELNRRISSDLRARSQQHSYPQDADRDVEAETTPDTKKTGRFTWVWVILIILAIISLICIAFI